MQQSVKRNNWPPGGPGGLADAPDEDLVALVQDGLKNRLIDQETVLMSNNREPELEFRNLGASLT